MDGQLRLFYSLGEVARRLTKDDLAATCSLLNQVPNYPPYPIVNPSPGLVVSRQQLRLLQQQYAGASLSHLLSELLDF